jgi:hypothetical protein
MQSVPITTNIVSSNPVHGEVYSIQHYVIKFVSDTTNTSTFCWTLLLLIYLINQMNAQIEGRRMNTPFTKCRQTALLSYSDEFKILYTEE